MLSKLVVALKATLVGLVMLAALGGVLFSLSGCTPIHQVPAPQNDEQTEVSLAFLKNRVVQVQALCVGQRWSGSGVVMYGNQHTTVIATANHVVDDPDCLYTVERPDGTVWPVFRVTNDSRHDVAIIRTMRGWNALGLPTKKAELGERVITIGYPMDRIARKTVLTHSRGSVLNVYEDLDARYWHDEVYRISAPINGGSSGGPCFSEDGTLLGLTVGAWVHQDNQAPYDAHYYVASAKYLYDLM